MTAPLWPWLCRLFEDKRFVDRHPGWREVAQKCALFDMRGTGDITQARIHVDDLVTAEHFAQTHAPPFPLCGFLRDDLVLLVRNPVIDAIEDKIACGAEVFGMLQVFTSDELEDGSKASPMVKKICSFVSGDVCIGDDETDMCNDASRSVSIGHKWNESGSDVAQREGDDQTTFGAFDTCACLGVLLHCLRYINAPERFIVRETSKKTPKRKVSGVPRLNQRPRYILLDKTSIKTRYSSSQHGEHRSPIPHLRRGHYRTLTAERYKEKGKRVWVRATHVKGNEVEWREGDRFYKVV